MIQEHELNCNGQGLMRDILAGKRVLVVDDDDDYAEAIDEVFSLQGCKVTRITDPRDAMIHASDQDFDLLIIDKNMPHLNGIEFVEQIRQKKPSSKVIMITAHPNEESRKKSLDAGVRYYLSKPFRKNDLLEVASFLLL